MEIVIYTLIFIIGALLGSFFTLATYRIPLKQDITHERSYCPKCNHRLEFLDLIPILSYIFLGGKCRYCKEKISPRYIIFEICSGLVFLLFAMSIKISIFNLEIYKLAYLFFGILYLCTLFILAGIDKEKNYAPKGVLIFGLIVEAIYIIYLYTLKVSIYKYVIYLFLALAFLLIYAKNKNYTMSTLDILMMILIFSRRKMYYFKCNCNFIIYINK